MGLEVQSSLGGAFLESWQRPMGIRASKTESSSFSDLNALLARKDASHCSLREKCLQRHRLEDSNQKS